MKVKVLAILVSLALCLSLAGVLAPPLSSPVMAANTWHVYPGDSIQAAINGASPGDTVIVHSDNGNPYTYIENIVVNKQLTLQGEGRDVVTVTAANSGDHVFNVGANNVNLSGFTATGGWDGISLSGDSSYCNVLDNTATNNTGFGIYLGPWAIDNTVKNCVANENGWSSDGGGIWLWLSYRTTIENCNANNNYIGIHLDSSYYNTIEGCTVNNNYIGIHLDGTGDNILAGNTVSWNTVHGILLLSSSRNQIIGNNILNNGGADSGIHLDSYCSDNVIHFNNIVGNSLVPGSYGIWDAPANPELDARNNWWGDTSGPYNPTSNPSGTGDEVSDNVDYSFWLGAPLVLPATHYEHLGPGTHVVDATAEADTKVTLTISVDKSETDIYIAKYESQPFPAEPFPDTALGRKYIDIFVSNPGAVVWPIHVEMDYTDGEVAAAGINEHTLGLYCYKAVDTFHRCSNTGVDTTNNIIWANVTAEEAGYLLITPFGAGGQLAHPPVVPTLSQWGVIGMATLFAVALAWMARRRFAAKAGIEG